MFSFVHHLEVKFLQSNGAESEQMQCSLVSDPALALFANCKQKGHQ